MASSSDKSSRNLSWTLATALSGSTCQRSDHQCGSWGGRSGGNHRRTAMSRILAPSIRPIRFRMRLAFLRRLLNAVKQYDLKRAEDIVVVDDNNALQTFGEFLFTAPQEDILEGQRSSTLSGANVQ